MKKHIEPKFDETYISETLDNGLKVLVWHKPEMRTTSCVFGTPYGGLDFELICEDGRKIHHPSGIAHFLEHKMFEMGNVDVIDLFSSMGANVNAFTSYTETVYYFSTSSEEIKEPLNLLLDFVQRLDITKESVEKEKGIITQELMMYMQNPDSRLFYELFKGLYHEHPYKFDIGGSPTSVNNTTFEQLTECYKLNYHPGKMILVCVGPTNPEDVLQMIKENQKKKEFEPYINCRRISVNEPVTVAKEQLNIPMEVSTNKVAVGIKLQPWVSSDKQREHQEWAIRCALEAHFSSLNTQYQKWINDNTINQYFDFDVELQKDSAFISFVNETNHPEDFKKFVLAEMKLCLNNGIGFKELNQLKKRYFGQAMRVLNDVEDIAVTTIRNIFKGTSIFETLELLQNLDQKQVEEALSHITLENVSLVSVVNNAQ